MKSLVLKAESLAKKQFKGKVDKGGQPYFYHLQRVAEKMITDNEKIVAYLHDIIEDTEIDFQFIHNEFGFVIAEAVDLLTKKPNDLYIDYISRISSNIIARKVKIADLEDNMNISRLQKVTSNDLERLNKYIQAYKYLKNNETK